MEKTIAVLPGDGIGEEVAAEALKILDRVGQIYGHSFTYRRALVGGAAFDAFGVHFPEETRQVCEASDAILFGSVGGPLKEAHLPKWKGCEVNSLLALRKAFNFAANLRPAKVYPQLLNICPLKRELIEQGIDLLIVRELIGDIYFGEKKRFERDGMRVATDLAEYTEEQISTVAHLSFQAAKARRKKLTSVDKANVLETSRLWREVVREIAKGYPEVEFDEMLVDNCAMQLIRNPSQFDVVLTSNMFGDILSDAAAVLPGSLGLTPSASLSSTAFGMFEPSGGSAPDIAGRGIANPIAQILSAAMMLQLSFGLLEESDAIEAAVARALAEGFRTRDIFEQGTKLTGTAEMGDAIASFLG